jgi:hypothetical protein
MTIAVVAVLLLLGSRQPPPGYPALYHQLQLPEMPGAVVARAGRQATSLADGIRIDIETKEDVGSTLKFFRDRLSAGGWNETPSRAKVVLATIGRVEFTKDRLTFSAMATRRGETTTVQLNVLERPR